MSDKQKPDQDVVNWMKRFDSLDKVNEATGDPKFDSMMGKIGSSTEPQSFNSDKVERTGQRAARPDPELINSLNNIMYTMHKSMKEFEDLMTKLKGNE